MTDEKSDTSQDTEITDAEIVEETVEIAETDVVEDEFIEASEPETMDIIDEYEEHDARQPSLSSRILTWLVLLFAGAAAALWGGPKLAPQLPEWAAPAAKYLTPGGDAATRDVAALRAEVTEQFENASQMPTSEELSALMQGELDALKASTDEKIAALEAQLAGSDTSTMDARISTVESRIEGVAAEMSALTDSVQASLSEGGSVSEAALAEISSKSAEVEGLRAELGEMTGQIGALTQRVEDAETAAADRVAKAQADAEAATARMSEIAASTAYLQALDDLTLVAHEGVPYAEQLNAFAQTTAAEIPAALSDNATTGVTALAALKSQFTGLSHEAIRASIKADAEETGGAASKFGAFLKSQVATRSLTPSEGDGTDAILSRINAALDNGDLALVATEADALSETASAPLSGWLGAVETRKSVLDILATLASQPS